MPDLTADPVFTPSFQQALDKEIRSRANMNLQMAGQLSLGPDEMAKGIKTAAHYGMSLEDYMQLGDLRKSLPDSLDNYGTGYPGVARWLADKPLNAAVAKDDLPALTSIEAMLRRPELRPLWLGAHGPDASWGELLAAQWSMGWNATTSGGLSDKYVGKYFFGQDNDAEIAALQEQQGLDAEVIERSSGFGKWLLGNAAQAIPSTFQVLKEGGKGAGIGALATAWTGPGAAFGGKLGFQAGAFQAAFRMEAGAALQQMEGMRDEAGNPPSREMMVSVASAVGLANASLELVGFGVMKRMFTSAEAKKTALRIAVEAALSQAGFKGAAKKTAAKLAEAVLTEGLTEGTQQLNTDLGQKVAENLGGMTKGTQTWGQIGWDVLQNAAAGTALPLTLGPISLAYHVATVKSQAEQAKDFVQQQDAISAAAQDSATTARGHGAGVLRTMFEEAKQPVNFWMTARDAQDLAQSGFSATLTKAGVNLDTLASQVETGAVLPVDRAVLLTDKDTWAAARDRVLPTPDGASLRESSTTLTPAEAKQMEELLASSQEGKYLAERTRIFREMTTAGVPKEQALAVMQHLDRQSAIMDMHADRGLAYLQSIRFAKEAPAAGPKAEVAAPAGGVTEFRTEKGSTYQVDPQGRTTRNKALHDNDTRDVGIQPISDRTIYVDKSAAGAFGMHQSLSGTKGVVIQGDRVFPVSKNNPQGKWGVAPSEKEGYAFSEIPEVGSAPLELWKQGDDGAWSNWHPGNAIVAIDRRSAAEPTRSAEAPAAAQTPPGYSAEAKTLLQRFKQFPVTMQQVRNSNEETTPIDMLPPELQGMKARMPIQYLAKKVHVGEANKMAQEETRPYTKKTLHQHGGVDLSTPGSAVGYRIGKNTGDRPSWNKAENRPEAGVSMLRALTKDWDSGEQGAWFHSGDIFYYSGTIMSETGSDGEPLFAVGTLSPISRAMFHRTIQAVKGTEPPRITRVAHNLSGVLEADLSDGRTITNPALDLLGPEVAAALESAPNVGMVDMAGYRHTRKFVLGNWPASTELLSRLRNSEEIEQQVLEQAETRPYPKKTLHQSAYHGTGNPEVYDRFSVKYVNGRGGEGTQNQGFGLYFTGREAVADWYRNKNSRNQGNLWIYDGKEFEPRSAVGIALDLLYELADTKDGVRVWDKETTVWWAEDNGLHAPGGKITWRGVDTDELEKIIEDLDQSKVSEASAQRGRLYTVDIPSDEELLNWDKPLREQTPAIQQKVVHAINDIAELTYGPKTTLASIQKFTGKELYRSMTQTILRHGYNEVWDISVPRIEAESIVSLAFADRGIPGTVYLSNTASLLPKDQQYNNYVIFNDSAITILSYRQEERGRIDIIRAQGQTPAQHLITLIEGRSDADTIFHELAHHFAQEVQDAVEGTPDSKPTASATLAKQWDTVKKALGVIGNTWTEDQEEKFADWTVAYMYTATAPPGLKGFFTRVRKWFSKVQDQLPMGIVLPDDVKAVFDTWNQAETAALSTAVWNALPFDDKIEGLTKKQSDRLRELYQTGRDQMVANLKKRQDQAASAARAKVTKDAEKILAQEPVYRAYKLIREAGGLSRDNPELGASLGEGINPLFTELDSKSLLGGTGDATAIAKKAGFEDVASMLAELQTRSTPEGYLEYRKGEAETAARNKVPSFTALCNTGEIAAYLYRVAEYLVSASNTKINNASQAAMEAYARQELDKLPLGQGSNANRFMGTFHRAMMAERRALLAGKIDVAATEAQRARLALEMARQAALRKKDIAKTRKLAKKISRLAKGKMGGDYKDAAMILAIRTKLIPAPANWSPHKDRLSITKLVNPDARGTEDVAIATPEWSPWLTADEGVEHPWTGRTAGEFRELSNLLSFLYTRGRQVIGALSDGTMAKAKRDECLATMKDVKSSKQLENANLMHKLPLLKQIWVNIPLFMMRYITGEADNFVSLEGKEGPNDRYIYKPLAKAESKGDAIESRVSKRLQKYGKWLQTFGDRMGRVIKTDVPVSAAMKRAGDHAWTVEHIVGLAQNRGTEANWRIALKGHDLTEDQGDALMNLLTAEDMAAVQSMWDAIGTLKTPMAEVFLRVNGYRMTEVVAQPFMHQGKRFAGGYFPLRYMTKKLGASIKATANEAEALLAERHNALFPRTENRQTMERTDAGGRSVLLHPHVLADHIHDAARYIACTETLQDAWSIVMNEEYMTEISRIMGVSYDRMQAWFVDRFHHMARPKDEAAKSSTLVRWMKGAASPFVLAYHLGSAASEITSLPVTADRIGFGPSLQAGWLMLFHPVESFRLANQLSPFVKRITTYFRDDSAQQLNELSIQNKYKRGWRMVQKIGMFPKMGMNHLMGIHAWWAAFYRALQTTDMRGKDFMEVARQAANQAMVDGKVEEAIYQADRGAAGAQSEKNPLEETDITKMQGTASLFMMMMTYWTQQFAGRRYSKRALAKGRRSYRRHAWSWFLQVPTVALMSTVINSFLWSRTPEDEPPEEFIKRWIGDVGMTQLAGVPFVRDALQAALVVMRDRGSSAVRTPGLGLIASSLTMEFFSRLGRAGDRRDQKTVNACLWAGANLLSLVSGVPVSRVYYRLTESWRQYQEEEAGPQTVLLMTPDPDLASKERARTR